jgi:excisionase family DNA binding protein
MSHGASMTISQASKRIGISPSKLYQLVGARRIGHYRVGGKIIFSENDITSFLAGCHVSAIPAENIPQPPRLKLKHIRLSRGS